MSFKHKKSLGQNFLTNEKILNNIVNSLSINPRDLIIEIGPGQGALTKRLVKLEAKVIAFEIDERLKEYLDKIDGNIDIIYKDILEVEINDYIQEYENVYVVANLPYYITTPIINKFLRITKVKEMIIMVQDEVANRINAGVGTREYGYFTVMVQSYFTVKKLFFVSRTSFNPIPKVDSAVIKLTRNKSYLDVDEKSYHELVKNAFRMKRKNLKNNLYMYDLEKIAGVLKKYNLDLSNRAEEVPIEVFKEIVTVL